MMFRPAAMVHIDILLSQKHLLPMVEYLGRHSGIHLTRTSSKVVAGPAHSREDSLALETYRRLCERISKLMNFFGITPQEHPATDDDYPISRDASDLTSQIEAIEKEVEEVQEVSSLLQQENERMNLLQRQIQPMALLDVDLHLFGEFSHVAKALGTVPNEMLTRLRRSLSQYHAIIIPLTKLEDSTVIAAFTPLRHEEVLRQALRSAFFHEISFPGRLKGTPSRVLHTIDEIRKENNEGLEEIERERKQLKLRFSRQLAGLWRQAENNRRTFESIGLFLKTKNAYLVTGWLPASSVETLKQQVDNITSGQAVLRFSEPDKTDREVPTKLDNPPWIRNFELLTKGYGIPAYDEHDPTLILALSSLVMFGAMFADFAHGLALAAIGLLLARWKLKQPSVILVSAGLSSALFGLLFGSIFGREDLIAPLWFSPMHSIVHSFKISCCFGAALVIAGILFNISNQASRGKFSAAFAGKFGFAGLAFYIVFLWAGVLMITRGFDAVGAYHFALLAIPLAVIGLREPIEAVTDKEAPVNSSFITICFESMVEVFETVVTFFSNTLSFVRIGAFALCHAGLCQAVYVLADDVAGAGFLGLIVIIGGNTLIVLFEGLIVGIQTMRLEYYEYFSKFFQSGGRPYVPFVLDETTTV